MPRFSRLGAITGIAALAFAVFGFTIAIMGSANADHLDGKGHDTNGLTISHLGI